MAREGVEVTAISREDCRGWTLKACGEGKLAKLILLAKKGVIAN